ncbi:hypothetical protein GJ744_009508 [Endocarpon pusillum]|uniref:Uncharacterized protein n=1 Tax=Endocarpon pusillum TaxID=364733 RepID=A0A8H7E648_9EURO|nr:hypothetical protein GJ744_009508 [Endocarpon pusillum]
MPCRIPIDYSSTNSSHSTKANSNQDRDNIKPHVESFLRNTEDPFIVGMTTRAGNPGMPAAVVAEPRFWSGQWMRRST